MTILKFMLTAIFVGCVGIYLLKDLGLVNLSIKSTVLGATIIGGLIFGIGWGLLGYCPGTSMGAVGEGREAGMDLAAHPDHGRRAGAETGPRARDLVPRGSPHLPAPGRR